MFACVRALLRFIVVCYIMVMKLMLYITIQNSVLYRDFLLLVNVVNFTLSGKKTFILL